MAFNITLGVEVELSIDPDTLKDILNFMFDKFGDKFDQIIGRRIDLILETAKYFTQLFGPLIGDMLKKNAHKLPSKFLREIRKNKFDEVSDFLSPTSFSDEECPQLECPHIEIQTIECPAMNCPECPTRLIKEVRPKTPCPVMPIPKSECTDYTELYPQINLCEHQEECQIKLYDCLWKQWFNQSQFWKSYFKPTDIPTFNVKDGTCNLREKLLICLLELNFWPDFRINP